MNGYILCLPFASVFINTNGNLTNRALCKVLKFVTEHHMIPVEFSTVPDISKAIKAKYKHYNSSVMIITDSETYEYSYQDWCNGKIVLTGI